MTVQRIETLWICLQIEAIHFDHIPLILHVGIAEGHLILECIGAYKLHRLQMRMEIIDNSQRHLQQMLCKRPKEREQRWKQLILRLMG